LLLNALSFMGPLKEIVEYSSWGFVLNAFKIFLLGIISS
jgi:hypothetical protein